MAWIKCGKKIFSLNHLLEVGKMNELKDSLAAFQGIKIVLCLLVLMGCLFALYSQRDLPYALGYF